MHRRRLIAAASLAVVAVAWGAIPLIVREDVPVSHLVAARLWLGAFALIGILAARGKLRIPATHRLRLVASGAILVVHWTSFFIALKETTVAVALAVVYLGPITAAVLAGRVLDERVGMKAKAGLVVAVMGTFLVVGPGSGATVTGVVAGLVAALTVAVLMLVAKPAAEVLGGLTVATSELVVASIIVTPWMFRTVAESRDLWPSFLVLGVLFTGVAFALFWTGMGLLPVAVVGVMMYIEPAAAVVWAAVFLGEIPDTIVWAGVALVIAGGALAALEVADEEVAGVPVVV